MEPEIRHKRVWPTFLWALLAFCLFGVIVIASVWHFGGAFESYPQKRAKGRSEALAKLREQEKKDLDSFGWVDQTAGLARIPIGRAMELTVVELSGKAVGASVVPVPTPAPPAPPADAAQPAVEGSEAGVPVAVPVDSGTPAPEAEAQPTAEDEDTPAARMKNAPARRGN